MLIALLFRQHSFVLVWKFNGAGVVTTEAIVSVRNVHTITLLWVVESG